MREPNEREWEIAREACSVLRLSEKYNAPEFARALAVYGDEVRTPDAIMAVAWDKFIEWWNGYAAECQKIEAKHPDMGPPVEAVDADVETAINEITAEVTFYPAVEVYLREKWFQFNNPEEAPDE